MRLARRLAHPLALGVAAVPLLSRMRDEFETGGTLSRSTASLMWGAYAVGAATYANALRRSSPTLGRTIAAAPVAAAGATLVAGGMGAFEGPDQLAGTRTGPLVTGGVYRYSRHPQYAGTVLTCTAVAVAARSDGALLVTGVLAAIYRWWAGVEERALHRSFGGAYRDYARHTPRWLGRPGS